jgi:hypothetical protein
VAALLEEKVADMTMTLAGEQAAPAAKNAHIPATSSAAYCKASELWAVTVKRKSRGERRNKPVKWTEEEHK